MDERKRRPNGTFEPGGKLPENARRAKGIQNKITKDIREGAIAGFARHGSNGRGEGGFPGFCFYLARKHPKAAAKIVEKLLPLQVNASGMGSGPSISQVNIISVPTDTYLSAEDMARFQPQMQTIEHSPPAEPIAPVEPVTSIAPATDAQAQEEERIIQNLRDEINALSRRTGITVDV